MTGKGKYIKIRERSIEHHEYLNKANSLLASPPKKRFHPSDNQTQMNANMVSVNNHFVQKSAVQTITIQSQHLSQSNTQASSTFITVMENRFQTIELAVNNQQKAQTKLDQRLSSLEDQTCNINNNITTLLNHLNIPSNTKWHKNNNNKDYQYMEDVEQSSLYTSQQKKIGGTNF